MTPREAFLDNGWCHFPADAKLAAWIAATRQAALAAADDPALREAWLRHGETWFAGVNALPNDARGRVPGGAALSGDAFDLARELYGDLPLDRAQVSVVYPGYPRRDAAETEAAHRFRLSRDAAHVDGMKPFGPERRRRLGERHAFILGLPFTASRGSPLVVWEGSHRVMRRAFASALEGLEPADWPEADLTEAYHAARREAFQTCPRRELPAAPGEATLVHRLTVHGVAPWDDEAATEPRMILYFRPELPGGPREWLDAP